MAWLWQLFSRRRIYTDLSEEIRQHLDETVEALIHEGMNRKDAEHAAKKKFGNATLIEERSHEPWQWRRLESFWVDLKYGLRQLVKAPGFSVTVIITIALGIGANAAIFNLMRAVVFPTLSVPNAKEMYQLRSISTPNDAAWLYSGPAFDRLRSASIRQADIAAHTSVAECNVFSNGSSGIDTARMQLVSTNFFSTLEVLPTRGRFLLNSDSAPTGGAWHAVLRFGFWQQHFASDPAIIGKSLLINGAPVVIIGVAPKQFSGVIPGEVPDLWLPLEAQKDVRYAAPFDSLGYGSGVSLSAPYRHQEALFWLTLIARVPRGLESSAIAAWTHAFQPDLDLAARFAPEEKRAAIKAVPFTLHPLAQSESVVFDRYSQPVTVLMMMVAAVLLIACINLANLQRSRLIARTHEFGVRASLGAGRGRVLQQLLVESGLLTFIGGVTAVIIAVITGPILLRWASPGAEPIPLDLNLSADVYSFIAALLALTFFAFAFIPSFAITRMDLASAARSHRTLTQSPSGAFSNILLSSQVALSLLLLALASMFARTLVNLNHVDTGFDRQHILTVRFAFHRAGYTQPRVRALAPQILESVQSIPGVRSAALDMCLPPGCLWNSVIHVAGHPELSESAMQSHQDNVGSGYFRTLGIPVVKGREFDNGDRASSLSVALVNQSLAKKLFGDTNPLGQKVGFGPPPADAQFTIIGVVGDARVNDLRSAPPPVFYQPISQSDYNVNGIAIRTSGDPLPVANSVHRALLAIDLQMPVTEINSLAAAYDRTVTTEHLLVRLTSIFGALALALAAVGIYGVLSFRVTRSISEIGVRMALGATRTNIIRMVMAQAMRVLLFGGIPGIALSMIAGRMIRTLLFGVRSTDIFSMLTAIAVLSATAALASFWPALRAASVDPMQSLRAE